MLEITLEMANTAGSGKVAAKINLDD